jgi:hypothetical protein
MDEEIETRTWYIWYISCEGNRHWYSKDVPVSWEKWQVEESIPIGGCGDDVSEIISVELYNELDNG